MSANQCARQRGGGPTGFPSALLIRRGGRRGGRGCYCAVFRLVWCRGPVAGVPVTFFRTEGDAQEPDTSPVVTDAGGKATMTVTMGALRGGFKAQSMQPDGNQLVTDT